MVNPRRHPCQRGDPRQKYIQASRTPSRRVARLLHRHSERSRRICPCPTGSLGKARCLDKLGMTELRTCRVMTRQGVRDRISPILQNWFVSQKRCQVAQAVSGSLAQIEDVIHEQMERWSVPGLAVGIFNDGKT